MTVIVETPVEDKPIETPVETPVETSVETPTTELPVTEMPVTTFNAPSGGACETEMIPGVLTSTIREFIGTMPCGFEYLEYAVSGAIMIILFSFVASFFLGFSKIMGAK